MAKDKKSFILYADLIEVVNELDNETKGLLLQHVLEYVNDLDPEPPNTLVKLAFIPIKQSLKRDLAKYKVRAETARLNGLKGGRPKTQETESVNSEPRKAVTVTVNDTVTDTVTETVIDSTLKKVPKKKRDLVLPFDSEIFREQWQIWKDYKRDEHKFNFKSTTSEQAALSDIAKKSEGIESKAIEIIHQSLSNGWKGFFKLKTDEKQGNTKNGITASSLSAISERLKAQYRTPS